MTKFRSWNGKLDKFFYWENGDYYWEKTCFDLMLGCDETNSSLFDWQNAEECYYENLSIPEIIYKNDIGVIEYEVEPYHDESNYNNTRQIKGIVGLDLFKGLYVMKDSVEYYVSDYKDSFFISIGNIHEGEKNE